MSIDLSQFHQVFFEESYEGLDIMESALLNLDPANVDAETINQIFRAAHSIKGGSGTFGFSQVAEFTHVVETLLDQIRGGERELTANFVELFLEAVDCIRRMMNQLEAKEPCDIPEAATIRKNFEDILAGKDTGGGSPSPATIADEAKADAAPSGWKIYFKPGEDIMRTGNDPLRMFRELASHGPLTVSVVVDDLPSISGIDPEKSYLRWNLELLANVDKSAVDEAFEWVVDESEIVIEPLGGAEQAIAATEAVSPAQPATPVQPAAQPESAKPAVADLPAQTNTQTTAPAVTPAVVSAEKASAPPATESKSAKVDKSKVEVSSIRVGIDKVDSLINMVGELVITQSMLGELGRDFTMDKLPKLLEGLDQLSQNTRELQESVMRIRMLPISFTFSRFPRLVHDLSRTMGKKIELKMIGENTELDKTVMERIGDPLVHLVRNSLDHGIEKPEDRIKAGKPETGVITLNAYHQGGNIIIKVQDDGAGLNRDRIREKAIANRLIAETDKLADEQIYDLIFRPGFSTAEKITDISGRGVGMDVVRRNIQELNGSVEVESDPGVGSSFTIRLPLTLAILDGQLVRVGEHVYILPLISIVESLQSFKGMIHRVAGGCDVLRLRNEYVPIIRLWKIFNIEPEYRDLDDALLVVVEGDNMKVAILVDDLLAQQQVVIKSLEENYRRVEGVSGATILGDGTVSLILDISGLIKLAGVRRDEYKRVKNDSGRAA